MYILFLTFLKGLLQNSNNYDTDTTSQEVKNTDEWASQRERETERDGGVGDRNACLCTHKKETPNWAKCTFLMVNLMHEGSL